MRILKCIDEGIDPRQSSKVQHNFKSIIFTTICAVLSGCESWEQISMYCKSKIKWLSQYIDLSNGAPSGDTFRRLYTMLDPNYIESILRTQASLIVKKKAIVIKYL